MSATSRRLWPLLLMTTAATAAAVSYSAQADKPEKPDKSAAIAPSPRQHIGAVTLNGQLVGEVVAAPTPYPQPFLVTTVGGTDVALSLLAMEESILLGGEVRLRRGWLPVHTYLRFEFRDCTGRVIVEGAGHSEDTGARPTVLENHLDGTYLLHIAEPGPMRSLTAGSVRDADAATCYPNMEKLFARFAERAVSWPHMALYSVRIP